MPIFIPPDFATFFIFYKQKNIEKYSLRVVFFCFLQYNYI